MLRLTAYNWYDAWYRLHEEYSRNPEGTIDQRFATRAVSFDNEIVILKNKLGWDEGPMLNHELVGYTKFKLGLFDRNYIVPGRMEKIGELLANRAANGRKLTVASYSFNIDSDAHEQGPCVINILITMRKIGRDWKIHYEVNMRIAEITRRLLVDFLKFYAIINYWTELLEQYKLQTSITFRSAAVYAEPISLTIAQYVFQDELQFDKDHWLHKAVQTKIRDYDTKELKFKRGRRIRKHVRKLQGGK